MTRITNDLKNVQGCLNTESIQFHPAWHGKMSLKEVEGILKGQEPFTFVITGEERSTFIFSYVRKEDRAIAHIKFENMPDGKWCYVNGNNNITPKLKDLILKMMHWTEADPEPTPLHG